MSRENERVSKAHDCRSGNYRTNLQKYFTNNEHASWFHPCMHDSALSVQEVRGLKWKVPE